MIHNTVSWWRKELRPIATNLGRWHRVSISWLEEGAMMNSALKAMRAVALTTALMASVSGIASADDNDMSRFGGDGYAYFHQDKPIVDKAPSTFRKSHPNGLSERQLEALSSLGLSYTFQMFTFDRAPSEWRRSHPSGLSEGELQALASNSSVWQLPNRPQASALALTAGAKTRAN